MPDVMSHTQVSRLGLTRTALIGKEATCPCGYVYTVGEQDELDHFVFVSRRLTPTHAGYCLMVWPIERIVEAINLKGYMYAKFPGDDPPVRIEYGKLVEP